MGPPGGGFRGISCFSDRVGSNRELLNKQTVLLYLCRYCLHMTTLKEEDLSRNILRDLAKLQYLEVPLATCNRPEI